MIRKASPQRFYRSERSKAEPRASQAVMESASRQIFHIERMISLGLFHEVWALMAHGRWTRAELV